MILRTIFRPIIVPHVPYIPHHTSVDVPDWVAILTLGLLLLAGIIVIIAIFKIK